MKVFLCSEKFGGCDYVGFDFRAVGTKRLCPECGQMGPVCEVDLKTVTAVTDSPAVVEEVRRVFAHEEAEQAIHDEEDDLLDLYERQEEAKRRAKLHDEVRMADTDAEVQRARDDDALWRACGGARPTLEESRKLVEAINAEDDGE